MQTIKNFTTKPERNSGKAWMVCMIASLYFFYMFFQMTKFNAIGHELMSDFKIDSAGLGVLSSIYFWGNMLFLFPAGLLLDRFSTKKLLFLVMINTIICTFLFSLANTTSAAFWCFLFTGISGSFALLIPLRIAARWFTSNKLALVNGLSITIGFLGAMVSQSPLTWLVNIIGWRHAMQWDAYLGVFLLLVMMLTIKDFPEGMDREMSQEQASSIKYLWHSLKGAVGNAQNWLFGLYTCLINLPLFVFGAVFGVRFLEQADKLTEDQAAFAMVLLFLGAMAGSPAFGWLSDKMGRRKLPMIFGGLLLLLITFVVMYVTPLNYLVAYVLFFVIGFLSSAQVITYPVIAESNAIENIGVSMSMGSVIIIAGGAVLVPLFGWLLDLHWSGELVNQVPLHSITNYRFALWMLPISYIIGLAAVLLGKETHCKRIV